MVHRVCVLWHAGSSDGWIGNIAQQSMPEGWNYGFHGQDIVYAVLNDMVAHRFGSDNSQFLYSGCSAGARGALFNTERVATYVAQLPSIARFGVLLDSAFWVDIQPINASIGSYMSEAQGVLQYMNVTGGLSKACLAKYHGAEGWKCLYGQYAVPMIDPSIDFFRECREPRCVILLGRPC